MIAEQETMILLYQAAETLFDTRELRWPAGVAQ